MSEQRGGWGWGGNVPVDQAEVKTYKFSHYRPIWCELAAATGSVVRCNRKTVLNAYLLTNIFLILLSYKKLIQHFKLF